MSFELSAGVYPFEIDKSAFIRSTASSICAVVAGLTRGPMGLTLVTSVEEYLQKFGNDTPASWSKAPYAIKAALLQTPALYVNRVVNGALYAGTSYLNNGSSTISAPFPTGTLLNYESGSRDIQLLTISDRLVSENTISVNVVDGEGDTTVIEQTFNNSSNETLASLAQKIQLHLNTLGDGGSAEVVKVWSSSNRFQQSSITFNEEITNTNASQIVINIKNLDNEVETITQNFETDNNATLQGIVNQINTAGKYSAVLKAADENNLNHTILINALEAGPNQFTVELTVTGDDSLTYEIAVTKEGHGVYDDRTIQLVMPSNSQATLANPDISGGSSQATATVESNVKLFDVFAENPGVWANSIGVKVSNIDYGTASRFQLTFTDAMVKDNVFSMDINWKDETYPVVVDFVDNSDASLQKIAESITSILSPLGQFGQAFVETVPGGRDNDRKITIISPDSSEDIYIESAVVTEGVSQPEVMVSQILTSIPSDNTFKIGVYDRSNTNSPLEEFTVSLNHQVDGNGNQQYIEDVINGGSSPSNYIRVKYNVLASAGLKNADSNIIWLNGGFDGAQPTNAQIAAAWDDFADPEQVTIRLLINAGYTNVAVQQKMVSIAESRKDCFAILDMPSDQQTAEAAVNYRKFVLNINSSYGAIYTPDLLITDDQTGEQLYVNPSGYVAGQYCYTDKNYASWWAPAGLNRGIIPNVQGVRVKYSEGHRDLLAPNQVNYIREMPGKGYPIWEEYTLQPKASALQDVHVRRLLITIEVSITDFLEYNIFDPNDAIMRSGIKLSIEEYLQTVQTGRGLQVIEGQNGYAVQCDDNNNPAYLIDRGICVVDVYIKPIRVARFIKLNVILTKSSADFSELMAAA